MADEPLVLSEAEVRKIVSLIGKVAVVRGNLAQKKRFVMDGLCEMLGVDCWVWGLSPPINPGERPKRTAFLHGGFDESRFGSYLKAVEDPGMGELTKLFYSQVYESGKHVTRLQSQFDLDDKVPDSASMAYFAEADIGTVLLSCHPFPDGSLSIISLFRRSADSVFDERDARIAHIVLSEVTWLHAESLPQAKRAKVDMLTTRQRETLNLLLEGLGRKQIAAQLGISENTVSGYVKQVYRFYKVQSHAELMKYFSEGDGGDLLPG